MKVIFVLFFALQGELVQEHHERYDSLEECFDAIPGVLLDQVHQGKRATAWQSWCVPLEYAEEYRNNELEVYHY